MFVTFVDHRAFGEDGEVHVEHVFRPVLNRGIVLKRRCRSISTNLVYLGLLTAELIAGKGENLKDSSIGTIQFVLNANQCFVMRISE